MCSGFGAVLLSAWGAGGLRLAFLCALAGAVGLAPRSKSSRVRRIFVLCVLVAGLSGRVGVTTSVSRVVAGGGAFFAGAASAGNVRPHSAVTMSAPTPTARQRAFIALEFGAGIVRFILLSA